MTLGRDRLRPGVCGRWLVDPLAIATSGVGPPLAGCALIVVAGAARECADGVADDGETFGVEGAVDAPAAVAVLGDRQGACSEAIVVRGRFGLGVGVALPGVEQGEQVAVRESECPAEHHLFIAGERGGVGFGPGVGQCAEC